MQRADARRVIELESGVRWERLTTWNDRDVDFLYTIYEVGGASSPEGKLVRHSGREFGIVLSGRLGVTVGFEEHVLDAGRLDLVRVDDPAPPAQRRRRGRDRDLGRPRPASRARRIAFSRS